MTSKAMTVTKKTPAKSTLPVTAMGISRFGFFVSSPSAAAPSNPAKDRNPKTAASPRFPPPVGLNTLQVKCWPCGP